MKIVLLLGIILAAPRPVGGADDPAAHPENVRTAPIARPAEWIPSPGTWAEIESSTFRDRGGREWRVVIDGRPLGNLRGDWGGSVPVTLPRVRVFAIAGPETIALAQCLPTGNAGLAVYPPESPEGSAIPSEPSEDRWGRWPNACGISILDASGTLDLDQDGDAEVALRRFCSCPSDACSGIVLLELNPAHVSLLDPSSLVDGVHLGHAILIHIATDSTVARPILRVAPDYLQECRFIASVGVRGENDCPDCCRLPVLLRRAAGGRYEPFYDGTVQAAWLKRAEDDLAFVAAGGADRLLSSMEQAQIARTAAFFYLTGSGKETRNILIQGLGARAKSYHVLDLLRRLDGFFLAGN